MTTQAPSDMSLRWFHVVFITTCAILSIVIAVWAVQHNRWLMALVALVGGTILVVYRRTFLEKVRRIGI